MNKLEKLADRLQASIDFATEHKEDFEASSWNYQEGVLLNHNEAKLVVDLVKKLTIPVVVGQSEQLDCDLCKGTGWNDRYTVTEECHICQGTGKAI